MIYLAIPHPHTDIAWDDIRLFDSFDAAEFFFVNKARARIISGSHADWGMLIVYEGSGRLKPIRAYVYSRELDKLIPSP